jgi:hypothetical protein
MAGQNTEFIENTPVSSEKKAAVDISSDQPRSKGIKTPSSKDDDSGEKDDKMGEIIALDTFRKK